MPTRTRIAAIFAALVAIAAVVPTAANAANVPMRGVVSGSPYGASNGQMAIPVLFSKTTASKAGLKSPVGVIIVGRTQKVKLPGGTTTLPVNLRTGDRFKGTGTVGSLQRRVFYPRVVFAKTAVYFRSKELSLAELSTAVDGLRTALAALQSATAAGFKDVYAQLSDLRKQLAALAALKVPDFQAQIDALTKKLNDLIASLPDFSKFALLSQLPDLTDYVQIGDLTGFLTAADLAPYATKAYVDGQINAVKALLPAGVVAGTATLPTTADLTAAVSGLASTAYVDGKVATLKAKINELASGYSTLCTQLDSVPGLPALTGAVNCPAVSPLP